MADGDRPAGVGTLTYNGVTFSSTVRVSVQSTPIPDDAGRTIKYVQHVLTAEDRIHGELGTGSDVEQLRMRLTTQGANLSFTNFGFGDLIVGNNDSDIPDVAFGPIPKVLEWQPVAGSNDTEGSAIRSIRFRWQVEVHIPECSSATYRGRVMAFGYTVDWSVDEHGMTTRTTTGYLEIPMTRSSSRTLPDTADAYREYIRVPSLANFKRKNQSRLSLNHARLDFTIIDEEIPSPYPFPVEIVDCEVSHSIESSLANGGWCTWIGVIAGQLYPSCATSKARAWEAFKEVVGKRLEDVRAEGRTIDDKEAVFLFQSARIREDIFGRPSSFQVVYKHVCSLATILKASKLWTPVTENDWDRWQSSIAPSHAFRGKANLHHSETQDAIIDLCGGNVPTLADAPITAEPTDENDTSLFENEKPDPQNSWMGMELRLRVQEGSQVVLHKPIPQSPTSTGSGGPDRAGEISPGQRDWEDMIRANEDGVRFAPSTTQDVLQTFGDPTYLVILEGRALRAGYPISIPKLQSIGDNDAVQIAADVHQGVVTNLAGVAIYGAQWSIAYRVNDGDPASAIEVPDNPMLTGGV